MTQVVVLRAGEYGEIVVATCDEADLETVTRTLRILQRLYPISKQNPAITATAARIAAPLENLLHWRKDIDLSNL